MTDELINYITKPTTIYTTQYIVAKPTMGPHALARSLIDAIPVEIKQIFAFCFFMTIVQKPQLHLYWSHDFLLKASIFNEVKS